MKKYRVFISYSHCDLALVESLDEVFKNSEIDLMWDRHLVPGRSFNDQIKSYIEYSHVFVPVISAHSSDSVWMHAEIGYAVALRIPVLPIGIGRDPSGMIQGVQAISLLTNPIDRDGFLSEVAVKLTVPLIKDLTEMSGSQPALFECPEDNTRRARLLADYAKSVISIGRHGLVRQKASLTSFHLPTRPVTHRLWEAYFGAARENRLLYENLLAERQSLEVHAKAAGCRLIIDSSDLFDPTYLRHGSQSARARVRGLLEFLEQDNNVVNVEIAINTDLSRKSSVTIVGDWFSSEAISSKEVSNLREAVFTRNAATVGRQIHDFDDEFEELLQARNLTASESRHQAILYLQQFLTESSSGKSV